jgi:hypothetical protein
MNSKLLLISVSIITLVSCSTAYKTGQTPDDVYYSPARYYGEEQEKKEEQKEEVRNRDYNEDRQIRMSTYDRRWRDLDNDVYYNPYSYGYNYGYYYNPFYYNYPVYNTCACACVTSNPKITTPRMTNLGGYGKGYNTVNNNPVVTKYGTSGTVNSSPVRSYNNRNNNSSANQGSKLGNTLNKIFNNSDNNNNNSNSSSTNSSTNRSYTPSSSSSSSSSTSSSSSSSSSSGTSSRPARSGKN